MTDDDGWVTVNVNKETKVSPTLPTYAPPNIRDAKTYRFSSLPRRVKAENQKTGFRLAREGELTDQEGRPAQLYYLSDSSDVLDEFGIGIGLYFKTVKFLFVVFLLCALISLISIYENAKSNPDSSDVDTYKSIFNVTIDETSITLVGSTYGATRDSLKYGRQAAADIVCVIFLVAALLFASIFAEKDVVEAIDAAQQTTQDYSVVIENPPISVADPKVYFDHFSAFGEVVMVTIAKNNGDLLCALADKRVLSSELERKMQFAVDEPISNWKRSLGIQRTVEDLKQKVAGLQTRIDGLARKDYTPWKVFITFNTEIGQRNCLERTSTGMWARYTGFGVPNDSIIGGKPLNIKESPEPNDMIYLSSHLPAWKRISLWLMSQGICGLMMLAAYFIIEALSKEGEVAAAVFIALCNAAMPATLKSITLKIEAHDTQTSMQQSMLFKLVLARCLVAAVLFYIATPFSETFEDGRLQQIQNILIADALTAPLIRLCDVYGYFMRYVYGPKVSVTQEQLNTFWQGTDLTLAERYTDILKTCFVGLFFAVPLPSGLFITAFAMVSTYFVDKFSLFRIWRRQAMLNSSMGKFSRYFLVLCVWVHLQISRIYFANWPYGGVDGKDTEDEEAKCSFFICRTNSDMTGEQQDIVSFYTGASIVGFCVCVVYLFFFRIFNYVKKNVLTADVSSRVQISDVPFRALHGPSGFIPLVKKQELLHPVLCCDIQKLPTTVLPLDDTRTIHIEARAVSVCNIQEFSASANVDEGYLSELFGTVVYFEDPHIHLSAPTSTAPTGDTDFEASESSLPVGWEVAKTESGKTYYVDHNTKKTYWRMPTISYTDSILSKANSSAKKLGIGTSMSSQHLGQAETIDLPYGWERRVADESGRFYYVNHVTKTTQWRHPAENTPDNA